jgi:hypothetical protein
VRTLGRDAAGFLLLALAATWPLALHFGGAAPGLESWAGQSLFPDTTVNLWNLWWFRHALVDLGQSPFDCPLIFHPEGASLWFHSLAPLHGLVALPLLGFVSLAAAQNLLVLLNLVASGVAASALGRELGLSSWGARLAGAVFAFAPVASAHLAVGHFELLSTFWWPLELLFLLRLVKAPGPRPAVALGLLLGLSPWASHYAFVYGLELLFLASLFHGRALLRARVAGLVGLTGAIAGLCVLPMAWHFLTALAANAATGPNRDFTWLSVDLVGFLAPPFTHPVLAPPLTAFLLRLAGPLALPQEHTAFLGFTTLALMALALRRPSSPRLPKRMLVAMVAVFAVLALGSELRIGGVATGLPLPAGVLDHVPILRLARAPGRHVFVVMLGLGLLAGAGLDAVGRPWLRCLLGALLAFEFLAAPLPLVSAEVGPVYRRLAQVPGEFAVLEIPFQVRDGQHLMGQANRFQALGQTVHGHPILGGMVSRLPVETWRALATTPLVSSLANPIGVTQAAATRDRRDAAAWCAAQRVEAIVVHPPEVGGPRQRYVESLLTIGSRESFPDGTLLLWIDSGAATAAP